MYGNCPQCGKIPPLDRKRGYDDQPFCTDICEERYLQTRITIGKRAEEALLKLGTSRKTKARISEDKMIKNAILVWPFHDAPEELKALSTNGGDEDWVALVPAKLVKDYESQGEPAWIRALGVCDVDCYDYLDMKVYIGSHA
jgi:hypothetical protein